VLLPTNALHAATLAPPRVLLARYPNTISGVHLRPPTSGYAHAGPPKRFVDLVGYSLGVALDAHAAGGRERLGRSCCWPNVEVRAFVSVQLRVRARVRERGEGLRRRMGCEPRTLFGIFATRELREGEEIVVGWEWDDANAVHRV
ncbi:hypothetical protein B0H19DRAFT_892450, partial [Mycena capillaripes]